MSYQNHSQFNGHSSVPDAAHFQIAPPTLPYSNNNASGGAHPGAPAMPPSRPAAVTPPQAQAPAHPRTTPLKRERAPRAQAASPSRHEIHHPELMRILMTSQTAVMPTSPTNPAHARVRPTAPIAKGPVAPRLNAQQLQLQQQMDKEKQMVVRGIGITVGVVMLLIVAVRCFADAPVKAPEAKTAPATVSTGQAVHAVVAPATAAPAEKAPLASNAGLALPMTALPPVFSLPQTAARKGVLATGSASVAEQKTLGHIVKARLATAPNDGFAYTKVLRPDAAPAINLSPVQPLENNVEDAELFTRQNAELDGYYATLRNRFWHAEHQMEERAPGEVRAEDGYVRRTAYLPPLEQPAALVEDYYAATEAADAFVKVADNLGIRDERMPSVLYLGGMANYTLGYKERSLALLQRLGNDFPNYRRQAATNGRDLPAARRAQPTAFGVNKLILALKLQTMPAKAQDSFAALKQFADIATPVVTSQSDFKAWLASFPAPNQSDFDENRLGFQPDQRRASVLPPARRMVEDVFANLIPAAIHQAGGKAVRDYLRTLISIAPEPEAPQDETMVKASNAAKFQQIAFEVNAGPKDVTPVRLPLADIIEAQLNRLDETILEGYRQQARQLAAQNNIPGARAVLKTLIAEYPGTAAAQAAQAEINSLTGRLTQQLRAEGDKKFNPAKQINVPQSEARAYFEKMYKEDPDGAQADYALMQWARALGTEGSLAQAIDLLKTLPEKFGGSEFEAEAKYMVGFYYGHNKIKKYDEAVVCMEAVANEYPDSDQAPEALWHAAYFSYLGKKAENGGKYLDQLEKYTGSPRFKHIGELRDLLKKAG